MNGMQWILMVLVGFYGIAVLRRLKAWNTIPVGQVPLMYQPQSNISVIIPVRNEEKNIIHLLKDLAAQNYPASLFEVLVVDDYSEDLTAELVKAQAEIAPFHLRYLHLGNAGQGKGKKAAVNSGVSHAAGDLLVLTDGDCRVQAGWLRHLEYSFRSQGARFISGPVTYANPANFFEKMQLVEFAALIGIGAGSMALGAPNMCNGANIAYTKQTFEEVNGFAGNEHVASGDDEFLMHKIFKLHPNSVFFLKAPEAIVFTSAKRTIAGFLSQRVRWASKWPAYTWLQNYWPCLFLV
jgi:cellulose synthase/poly-beta-1,6-N-acetylglucosamine synthase-like glycosyltransferase